MENIRNYKTNCKENLMNFYYLKNKYQSGNYKDKPGRQ